MTTKSEIIAAVQAAADGYFADETIEETKRKTIALSLGTPGQRITIAGQTSDSNAALSPEPTVFATLIEGIADWLNAGGIGEIATIKAKLNELIQNYNQLLDDYDNTIVPSAAQIVTELP